MTSKLIKENSLKKYKFESSTVAVSQFSVFLILILRIPFDFGKTEQE
jgi:hypothetical protein